MRCRARPKPCSRTRRTRWSATIPRSPATRGSSSSIAIGSRCAAGGAGLVDFYRFWRSLPRGGRFPPRRVVDPTDTPHLLPGILLLDVLYAPLVFESRLIGGDIVARSGLIKGKRVRAAALRPPA